MHYSGRKYKQHINKFWSLNGGKHIIQNRDIQTENTVWILQISIEKQKLAIGKNKYLFMPLEVKTMFNNLQSRRICMYWRCNFLQIISKIQNLLVIWRKHLWSFRTNQRVYVALFCWFPFMKFCTFPLCMWPRIIYFYIN